MREPSRIRMAVAAVVVVVSVAGWLAGVPAREVTAAPTQDANGARVATPQGGATGQPPLTPAAALPGNRTGAQDPAVQDLDRRIQTLETQFHAELDPLEKQVKALRDQYDPQIKALEQQRHELVEAGKPAEIQELDRQESAELAALADQEKAEIERVRQHYGEERTSVQAKYRKLREDAKGRKP